MLGNFPWLCCHLLTFFRIFKKIFQEHYQSVKGFGSRSEDRFLVLIWVKTVCKVYQQKLISMNTLNHMKCQDLFDSVSYCHLLITFAKNSDLDQVT